MIELSFAEKKKIIKYRSMLSENGYSFVDQKIFDTVYNSGKDDVSVADPFMPKLGRNAMIWGFTCLFAFLIFLLTPSKADGMEMLAFLFLIVGVILFVAPILIIKSKKNKFVEEKEYIKLEYLEKNNHVGFINECEKNGYSDKTEDSFGIHNICQIAKKYRLSCTANNYKEVYQEAKNTYKRAQREFARLGLQMKEQASVDKVFEATKYYGLYGAEKRKRMLQDMADTVQKKVDIITNNAVSYVRKNSEAKVNPYAMGGAAQGIGGLGAGLAAYQNAVIDNAKADAHNTKVKADAIEMGSKQLQNMDHELSQLSNWKYQIERADSRYVEKREKLIEQLEFSDPYFYKNDFGALELDVSVKAKEEIIFPDKSKGVIDGYISALIRDSSGEQICNMILTLPWDGLSTKETSLHGTSTIQFNKKQHYSAEFMEDDLWVIQK